MKTNEVIFRQNRVVYTLMILIAVLGLTWAFWEHAKTEATPQATSTAAKAPASKAMVWKHK